MIDARRTNQYSDSDADDMLTAIPLRATTTPQRPRNVLEAQVQDGDTLQAIAIRYRCSVLLLTYCTYFCVFKSLTPHHLRSVLCRWPTSND